MEDGVKIKNISITAVPEHPDQALVSLMTEHGPCGHSICDVAVSEAAADLARRLLFGEDARAVTALYAHMHSQDNKPAAAIATLDMALWDAKAKGEGVPLWRSLGGDGRSAYLISDDHSEHAARITLTDDAANDLDAIAAAHKALSRRLVEPVIMVMAPENWTADIAIARMQEIEQHFDISYIEAPCSAEDIEGQLKVSAAVRAGVAEGRSFSGRPQFAPHLKARSLDMFLLNIHEIGITGAIEMADAAFTYELPILITGSAGNVGVHLAGAMPYFAFAEKSVVPSCLTTSVHCDNGIAKPDHTIGNGLGLHA